MKKIFKNLLVNAQQYVNILCAVMLTIGTLAVAIAAVTAMVYSVIWAYVLFTEPSALHNAEAFNTIAHTCLPVNLPLWSLPITVQGILMVFIGTLGFLVASYTGEWLNIVIRTLAPATSHKLGKLQPFVGAAYAWWTVIIIALRKVALFIMTLVFSIGVVYFVWNTLSTKLPM